MTDRPESLAAFIEDGEAADRSLAVVNRTRPQPIQDMLAELFARQTVAVEEVDVEEVDVPESDDDDVVVLLEDGDVVASSPLRVLEDEILMVNSDLYITGTKRLEDVSLPAVFEELAETPFRLRGYPQSHSEKLPLIMMSRYIERLAWEHGSGRLRSSFQRLSRLKDERGTRIVYETIGETDVDVHVYGVPNWVPPESFPGVIHAGYFGEFRTSWFVVYHAEDDDRRVAALAADRVDDNEWEALWTFDPDRVRTLNRYIERRL
jgi:DICT domain-containing protein